MIHHVKYPSIEQFRTVIKQVRDSCKFHNLPTPQLKFRGTVKLHGTNAAVVSDGMDVWAQSRENVITPLQDNAGFAQYVHTRMAVWNHAFEAMRVLDFAKDGEVVSIFGEWCGGNIQKTVALNQLEKMFVVFGVRVGTEEDSRWLDKGQITFLFNVVQSFAENRVYSIFQFPTYEVLIDFSNPELVQNQLGELTQEVERECPVGKHFGVSGVGEGIVWQCISEHDVLRTSGLRFKVKGDKHSVSKVTKLAEVDVVKVANVKQFVDTGVTVNRMQQMKDKLVEQGLDANDVKNISAFLKLLGQDVIKEELDTMEASGLTTKDVMGVVNRTGRDWFIANIG